MSTTSVPPSPHPLASQPSLLAVLSRLHSASLAQEKALSARGTHFPTSDKPAQVFEDQLVALDEDKCKAMYALLRAMGARRVVEAGTSHGVSLLWLLAAVLANDRSAGSTSSARLPALVIGTEHEPRKSALALSHVREAFDGAGPGCLSLLEGDILELLPVALADEPDRSIDALLLDIWAQLALPTLKIVERKFRIGGVVLVDNVTASETRYAELLAWLRRGEGGWVEATLPFDGGFGLFVYVGEQ